MSQCDSTYNGVGRSVPAMHQSVAWMLTSQQQECHKRIDCKTFLYGVWSTLTHSIFKLILSWTPANLKLRGKTCNHHSPETKRPEDASQAGHERFGSHVEIAAVTLEDLSVFNNGVIPREDCPAIYTEF